MKGRDSIFTSQRGLKRQRQVCFFCNCAAVSDGADEMDRVDILDGADRLDRLDPVDPIQEADGDCGVHRADLEDGEDGVNGLDEYDGADTTKQVSRRPVGRPRMYIHFSKRREGKDA